MKNLKINLIFAFLVLIILAFVLFGWYTSSKQGKLASTNADLHEQLAAETEGVAGLEKSLAEAKQKNAEAKQENSGLKAELLVLEKIAEAAKKLGKKYQNLRLDYAKLAEFLAALQKENKKNVNAFDELNEDYLSAQAELQSIKSLIDQLVLNSLAEQGIKLGEVYFKTGSSKFFAHPAKAKETIAKIREQINPKLQQVIIVGYSDAQLYRSNHELNNVKLSTNRGLTILKKLGHKTSFVAYVSGKGNIDNTRRVAVYIAGKKTVKILDALMTLKKEIE